MALSLLVLVGATPAQAEFGITSFDNSSLKADGTVETGAGVHPYDLTTAIDFPTVTDSSGTVKPEENLKDLRVDLPVGFAGDPTIGPKCTDDELAQATAGATVQCPMGSQVGTVAIRQALGGTTVGTLTQPLFNMETSPGTPAEFGFTAGLFPVTSRVSVRTGGDYGLSFNLRDIPQPTAVLGTTITLWGVPADASHDVHRGQYCVEIPPFVPFFCNPGAAGNVPGSSGLAPLPFLTNPSDCSAGPLTTKVSATSWQHPDEVKTAEVVSHLSDGTPAGVDSCDRLKFQPTLTAKPVVSKAGAPSGLAVDLGIPQNDNPTGLATPPLKKAVVKLPVGMTVAAGGGDGLVGCALSDVALTSPDPAHCPDAAKIGSVKIDTPVLPDPIEGSIYLATQNDNPFHSLLAMYIVADGQGVVIKLPGKIEADPATGQLTTTVDNSPQLPFSNLHLQFKAGVRAPLRTPKGCGTYITHAEMTSWASPTPVSSDSSFTINSACDLPGKFEPTLDAGLTNPAAGGSSSFVLNLSRPDGEQDINGLTTRLPPGLLAHVGTVPLCPDAQANAGTCSAESQVGTTTVSAGAGSSPLSIPMAGKAPTAVYLAGPYKGAPYSLSIVVPAQAGPLDLGVVIVRAALYVDPVDAHVTVKSDPIPTILQGIPLDIQRITVNMNRPGFMVSPTSCDPMQITGTVTSAQGASKDVVSRFQVGDCQALGFLPKLAIGLAGRGQTTDGKHPSFSATLKMPAAGANLKKVSVTLPLSLALDTTNSQSNDLCEFASGFKTLPECPARSIVGRATATTPLLNEPLRGPVYFVKNVRTDPKTGRQIRTLPALAIPLQGGGITLVIRASSQVVDNHLVATFDKIPDAPVSDFQLNLNGGKKGILVVSGVDICKSTQVAQQVATAHSGKQSKASVTLGTPCKLAIVKSSHTATSLKLTLSGLGAGKLTVSGGGLVKTTKTLASSTTAMIQAKLSRANQTKIAHGRDVRVRVKVTFAPAGSKKVLTMSKTLTVHG